jgi:hypothetical protein
MTTVKSFKVQTPFLSLQTEKVPPFFWMQGVEDMVIWVMLPEGTTKKDLKVKADWSRL